MDIKVDAKEVVQHLHERGFSNITNEQLKEFIKDLKKLIKYDIRNCRCHHTTSKEYSYVQNSSETYQSVKSSYKESETSISNCSCILKESSNHEISKESTSDESDDTGSSSSSMEVSSSDSTSVSSDISQQAVGKKEKPSDSAQQKRLRSACRSAFIRAWDLQKAAIPNGTVHRSDPVKLYHQYQSVWKKQKIPGENCHADLRWAVRERMLGENPNPMPASHASSLSTLHRRRKT